jgi:cytochrome P450
MSLAVEELLRYDGPVQFVNRIPAADIEIGGVTIPAGDTVLLAVAAANRDPERFAAGAGWDPDGATGHLSFGHGAHHCLGAVLARREAQAAFRAVLAFEDLRLACPPDDLVWEPGLSPALRALPVRFTPRADA